MSSVKKFISFEEESYIRNGHPEEKIVRSVRNNQLNDFSGDKENKKYIPRSSLIYNLSENNILINLNQSGSSDKKNEGIDFYGSFITEDEQKKEDISKRFIYSKSKGHIILILFDVFIKIIFYIVSITGICLEKDENYYPLLVVFLALILSKIITFSSLLLRNKTFFKLNFVLIGLELVTNLLGYRAIYLIHLMINSKYFKINIKTADKYLFLGFIVQLVSFGGIYNTILIFVFKEVLKQNKQTPREKLFLR